MEVDVASMLGEGCEPNEMKEGCNKNI